MKGNGCLHSWIRFFLAGSSPGGKGQKTSASLRFIAICKSENLSFDPRRSSSNISISVVDDMFQATFQSQRTGKAAEVAGPMGHANLNLLHIFLNESSPVFYIDWLYK